MSPSAALFRIPLWEIGVGCSSEGHTHKEMSRQFELFASIGERRYCLRCLDDGAKYLDIELESESPSPLPAQRHRVARDAFMRRLDTGADPTIDEIVRKYLDGAA
jgi:hypothetical protein